jgi:hypothetical protein
MIMKMMMMMMIGIEMTRKWCRHILKPVSEHEDEAVMEARSTLRADREIIANKPDIITKTEKKKHTY